MPAKNKIYIAAAAWLIVCLAVFGYFFKILDRQNTATLAQIVGQNNELAVLDAQQKSFTMAKQDLADLAKQSLLPDDFFSQDVTLVKEIQTLENLGNKLQVNFNLSGLSGTVKNAPKAKTQGDIVTVPYSISLSGSFPRVVDFIETMENLSFITHLTTLSLSGNGSTGVNANLTAIFYVRR